MYRLPAGIAGMPQSVVREQSIPAPSSAILQDSKKTTVPDSRSPVRVRRTRSTGRFRAQSPPAIQRGLAPVPKAGLKENRRTQPKHRPGGEERGPPPERQSDTNGFSGPQPKRE